MSLGVYETVMAKVTSNGQIVKWGRSDLVANMEGIRERRLREVRGKKGGCIGGRGKACRDVG